MIKKIKELMDVNEIIKAMSSSVGELSSSITSLKKEISGASSEIKNVSESIKADSDRIMQEVLSNLDSLSEFKKSLDKELYDFKIIKSQIKEAVLHSFNDELHKEILSNLDILREDSSRYAKMRGEISAFGEQLSSIKEEMKKFSHIAKQIRASDYSLDKYAQRLEAEDKEKLRLLKRIDDLERLLAKERRSRH